MAITSIFETNTIIIFKSTYMSGWLYKCIAADIINFIISHACYIPVKKMYFTYIQFLIAKQSVTA